MTPSEIFVSELCKKSFLPFWSFVSPLRKKNKELCDVLVVCGNLIIIISVKDISISDHTDEEVKYQRWVKKAIHESVDQIYGAERYLNSVNEVLLEDGESIIRLPSVEERKIFRLAIAFGSRTDYLLPTGDFGSGFVSVFDEKSTSIVFNELDTITDFTDYLIAKEKFTENKIVLIPTEVDFLALYLQTSLKFDIKTNPNVISSTIGLWDNYIKTKEYSDWRIRINVSYVWDNMIKNIHLHHINKATSNDLRFEIEESVRYINLEPRINRIELGKILNDAITNKIPARMLRPMKGANHTYVIITLNDKNWDNKVEELKYRCIVARLENPATEKIIGIAIGSNSKGDSCFDICYLDIADLDEEFIREANFIKNEFGYFKNQVETNSKNFN